MRISQIASGALMGLLVLMLAPANAAVITQSNTTGGSAHQFASFGGTFNQFDPSLGTLNSVGLNFSGGITYFISFTPDPPDCSPLSCFAVFGFSTGYSFNAPGFPITVPNQTDDFFAIVNWNGSAIEPDFSPQNSGLLSFGTGNLFADSAFFPSYLGTGLVDVVGSMSEDSDYCEGAFTFKCNLGNQLSLTTTLTYDFTPVPEPLTLSLFGTGFAGMAAIRRRKKVVRD